MLARRYPSTPTVLRLNASSRAGPSGGQEVAGSNPVAPTILQIEPFGECVEGLSHCEVEVYVINGAVHSGDFEDSPLRVAIIIRWLARKESSQRLAESILRYANHDVARVWLYFWCTVLLMAFSPIFFVWADSNERLLSLIHI